MSKGKIVLGDREFAVTGLTFDELQEVLEHFNTLAGARVGSSVPIRDVVASGRQIITAALAGQIDAADLAELRTSVPQIIAAVAEIGRVSGLDTLAGELPAGASSIGTTSTPR